MAKLQVIMHEPDSTLDCFYQDHDFELFRDHEGYGFRNWYAIVKNDEGSVIYDGWVDDSNGMSTKQAFEMVCASCELSMPEYWPEEIY